MISGLKTLSWTCESSAAAAVLLQFALLGDWAQAVEPVLVEPAGPTVHSDWGTSVTAMGGRDSFSGSGLLMGMLRGGIGATRSVGQLDGTVSYGTTVVAWPESPIADLQVAAASLRTRVGVAPIVGGRASIGRQWGQGSAGIELRAQGDLASQTWLSAEIFTRGGADAAGGLIEAGPLLSAGVGRSFSPHLSAGISSRLQVPMVAASLPIQSTSQLVVAFEPSYRIVVRPTASVLLTGSRTSPAALGFLPSDSGLVQGALTLQYWFLPSLAATAEGNVEAGFRTLDYDRISVSAGLTATFSARRTGHIDPIASGALRFSFEALGAGVVAIAGTFTDWELVTMDEVDGHWSIDMAVSPGVHQYVYVVDGVSTLPPEVSDTRQDDFGVTNGVLYVD